MLTYKVINKYVCIFICYFFYVALIFFSFENRNFFSLCVNIEIDYPFFERFYDLDCKKTQNGATDKNQSQIISIQTT